LRARKNHEEPFSHVQAERINLTVGNLTVSSIEVTDSDLHNGNVTQARTHAHVCICVYALIARAHSNREIYMHYEQK